MAKLVAALDLRSNLERVPGSIPGGDILVFFCRIPGWKGKWGEADFLGRDMVQIHGLETCHLKRGKSRKADRSQIW